MSSGGGIKMWISPSECLVVQTICWTGSNGRACEAPTISATRPMQAKDVIESRVLFGLSSLLTAWFSSRCLRDPRVWRAKPH